MDFGERFNEIVGMLLADDLKETSNQVGNWFWLAPSDLRWSDKPQGHPYLCLDPEPLGSVTVWPRTTKTSREWPHGVSHPRHLHAERTCRLDLDAIVLACDPQPLGAYILAKVRRECLEGDVGWLTLFEGARSALQAGKLGQ